MCIQIQIKKYKKYFSKSSMNMYLIFISDPCEHSNNIDINLYLGNSFFEL